MSEEFSNDLLIDANNLKNNNVQKRHIKENIVEILRKINEELKMAHRDGKHSIITELPILFDIPNMCNKDSQRVVWAQIIEVLKKKNYRVWIHPTIDSCRLKITWLGIDDEKKLAFQTKILADHSQQF